MPADQTKVNMLLDFYGQILSEKQRNAVIMYYSDDMSITEIADELGVSRQAAYDNVKRGLQELTTLDEKLNLMNRFSSAKNIISEVYDKTNDPSIREAMKKLEDLL